MRKILFAIVLAFTMPFAAHASDEAPRITKEELRAKIETNEDIIIYDVRAAIRGDDFEDKIKGAVRVPVVEIFSGKALPEDKSKEIILYCV